MNDAYSNLLGEYITADQVEHADIAGFQIVCPCCREEIFKVARERAGRSATFFSHYRASKSISAAECERRVALITDGEKSSVSARSRFENVKMLRSVVRDAVAMIPISGELYHGRKDTQFLPMTVMIIECIGKMVAEWGPAGRLENLVDDNDRAIEQAGHVNLTSFGRTYRNRIASDLVRTIYANAHSPKTLFELTDRAFFAAFRPKGVISSGMAMLDFRSRSKKLSENKAARAEHGRQGNPAWMSSFITLDAMLRELHRLPFEKMIANARAKRPPLEGVTLDDFLPDLEDAQPDVNYEPERVEYVRMETGAPKF